MDGGGREFNNFVLLTLGTGIGGGIVYEKNLPIFLQSSGI